MQSLLAVSRRKFLGLLSAAGLFRATEPLAASACAAVVRSAPGYKVLKPSQVATLEAIAEQIIPRDQDPGAREAGVVHYIDNILARNPSHEPLPHVPHPGLVILAGYQSEKLALYVAGMEGVDQTSQLTYGRKFLELPFGHQTSVLKSLEQGRAQGEVWRSVSSRDFFVMVWGHVLEGFYGPPRDGGNRNCASWKMVRFPERTGTM